MSEADLREKARAEARRLYDLCHPGSPVLRLEDKKAYTLDDIVDSLTALLQEVREGWADRARVEARFALARNLKLRRLRKRFCQRDEKWVRVVKETWGPATPPCGDREHGWVDACKAILRRMGVEEER
jgi:hypothetical protein